MANDRKTDMEESASRNVKKENKSGKKRLWLRILLWFLASFLALVILIVVAVVVFIDPIVKTAVTKVGTMATGTGVDLESVSIMPLRGRLALNGFAVLNPKGYDNREAFQFKEFSVSVNPASLSTPKVEVTEIRISGLDLNFELTLHGTNLTDIKNNIDQFTRQLTEDSAEPSADSGDAPQMQEPEGVEPATDAAPKEEKKVVIRLLSVTDSSISFSNASLGLTMRIPLPDIAMTDVGDGRPLSESVQILYDAIYDAVLEAVKSATMNIKGAWNGAVDGVGSAAKNLGNAAGSAASSVGDTASDAIQGLKGLFGTGEKKAQ